MADDIDAVSMPIVRAAELSDMHAIAEFQVDSWREAYAGLVPQQHLDDMSVSEREARWTDRLLTGRRDIALATYGDRIVGVISTGPGHAEADDADDLPTLEVKTLHVSALDRGSGLAARLMSFAIGEGPAQLWVFEANQRARAFYERLGFVADGHRRIDDYSHVPEVRLVRV